jgi:hypothetical protein
MKPPDHTKHTKTQTHTHNKNNNSDNNNGDKALYTQCISGTSSSSFQSLSPFPDLLSYSSSTARDKAFHEIASLEKKIPST